MQKKVIFVQYGMLPEEKIMDIPEFVFSATESLEREPTTYELINILLGVTSNE